jgi:predicted phosphate transport protein (TIGR00153 family)
MLGNLFAKNPFTPLRGMMKKTLECVEATDPLFEKLYAGDADGLKEDARRISILEHEVDELKRDIRSRLTSSIFTPVDRRDVLQILAGMDNIADNAEDLGVLLTLRRMEVPPDWLKEPLEALRDRVKQVVNESASVIDQVDALVEAGFSGPDADRVSAMADQVNRLEHEADKAQDVLGKTIFEHEDDLKPGALIMWINISKKLGDLANSAEHMVNGLRLVLVR